jgi:hypothetical protein
VRFIFSRERSDAGYGFRKMRLYFVYERLVYSRFFMPRHNAACGLLHGGFLCRIMPRAACCAAAATRTRRQIKNGLLRSVVQLCTVHYRSWF